MTCPSQPNDPPSCLSNPHRLPTFPLGHPPTSVNYGTCLERQRRPLRAARADRSAAVSALAYLPCHQRPLAVVPREDNLPFVHGALLVVAEAQ
ncbi:hypothetical protein BaRGS_00009956 [Batillaria attramentaria]|uniref:Uncharacterized protein n=1 Tax=Batillaria attramentaria TaxID=370345 RepID=A0ABD0LIP7_9CAEN